MMLTKLAILSGLFVSMSMTVLAQVPETLSLRGKNQQLHLYGNRFATPILLSSGDLGWAGLVVHVAEYLSAKDYWVVGLNSKAYLASFTTKNSALNPQDVPSDFHVLVDYIKRQNGASPILAGISEGAGLSVLAATDPTLKPKVRGILALGLPDQNELGWRWQDFTIWITKKTPDEPSFMVEDIIAKVGPVPLAEIHSTHDEFVSLDQAKKMLARAGEPKKMWIIEAATHRFSDNRAELDQRLLEALEWIKSQK
jgi:alpha-beta hydrolase superfamily lysophospholipase